MTLENVLAIAGATAVAIGMLGTAIEVLGEAIGKPGVARFGQRLEAIGTDLPKIWRGSRLSNENLEIDRKIEESVQESQKARARDLVNRLDETDGGDGPKAA